MAIDRIKKRNGSVVDFDRFRIDRAMGKAFAATRVVVTPETLESIDGYRHRRARKRVRRTGPRCRGRPGYRREDTGRTGLLPGRQGLHPLPPGTRGAPGTRKIQILDRIERRDLSVKKRSGEVVRFDLGEIERAISNCCRGYEGKATSRTSFETHCSSLRRNILERDQPGDRYGDARPDRKGPGLFAARRASSSERSL